MPIKYLPNIISLLRLILVLPFIYYFLNNQMAIAFVIFIAASFSDGLDGWIARCFDCQSRLGLILDPVADKMLIISCFVLLAMKGFLSIGLVCLVLLRDIFILLGAFISLCILKKNQPLYPTLISKINTVLQMVLIILCLSLASFNNIPPILIQIMSILVVITTSASFIQYIYIWHQKINEQ